MLSIIIVSLLSSAPNVDWFEGKPIYENPIGYVRSPETGMSLKSSSYRGADLKYLDAEIGRVIPIVRWKGKYFDAQLGAEAGGWFVLSYYQGRFPLITQDFLLAIPLMFRVGSLSGALKFNHLSAHVSEGFDELWEKTLSAEQKQKIQIVEQQENVSISPPIENYSRDFWSLEISKEANLGSLKIKSSAQLAYIHKIIPHGLGRWFGGDGIELQYFGLYTAGNVFYYQDTETLDLSGEFGWLLDDHDMQPRIFIGIYKGSDRRGQFMGRQQMKELSLGFAIR